MEISYQILDGLMSGPLRKTHVCYKVNLDSRLTNRYLSLLQSVGLIKKMEQKHGMIFGITEKGVTFRNKFLELNELLDINKPQHLLISNKPQLIEI